MCVCAKARPQEPRMRVHCLPAFHKARIKNKNKIASNAMCGGLHVVAWVGGGLGAFSSSFSFSFLKVLSLCRSFLRLFFCVGNFYMRISFICGKWGYNAGYGNVVACVGWGLGAILFFFFGKCYRSTVSFFRPFFWEMRLHCLVEEKYIFFWCCDIL